MRKLIEICTLALLLGAGYAIQAASAAADEPRQERPAGRPAAPPGRPAALPQRGETAPANAGFDTRGQVLDSRYNHGRYYPPRGSVMPSLPAGYHAYYRGGRPYYFNGGIWYAPGVGGFVVVAPPVGVVISALPPYCSTLWFGGVPYYYANNVYYTWQPDQNGYAVVDPPDNPDAPSAPPPDNSGQPAQQQDLIVYPKDGQTKDQQAADQYDCYNWAKGQTGFDPTQPDGTAGNSPASRNNYNRAMTACLTARGYQVN